MNRQEHNVGVLRAACGVPFVARAFAAQTGREANPMFRRASLSATAINQVEGDVVHLTSLLGRSEVPEAQTGCAPCRCAARDRSGAQPDRLYAGGTSPNRIE